MATQIGMRDVARQGLAQSDRFSLFNKTRKNAEAAAQAVDQLRSSATAAKDEATLQAVALADAATTVLQDDASKLAVLRTVLEGVQNGVTAGMCPMAGLAMQCLSKAPDSPGLAHALFGKVAPADPFASFVRRVAPRPEDGLSELCAAAPTNAQGYATTAERLLSRAYVNTTDAVLTDLRTLATTQNDALTLAHLQRYDQWQAGVPSGVAHALASATLHQIATHAPDAPLQLADAVLSRSYEATALADRALDAAPSNDWLEIRARLLPALAGTSAATSLTSSMLSVLNRGLACDRAEVQRMVSALASGVDSPAALTALLDEIGARTTPALVAQTKAIAAALPAKMQTSFLRTAIAGLVSDPGKPLERRALAEQASAVLREASGHDDVKAVAAAFLPQCAAHAEPLAASFAPAAAAALRESNPNGASQQLSAALGTLQHADLVDIAQCTSAALSLITGSYYSSADDQVKMLPAMLPFVSEAARTYNEPGIVTEVGLLQRQLARTCYEPSAQATAAVEGLKAIVNQDRVQGSRLANFASTVSGQLRYGPDQVAFMRDALKELSATPGYEDAGLLLSSLADSPAHPQYVANWLQYGMYWLSSSNVTGTQKLHELGQYVLGQASGYELYHKACGALADGYLAVAQRHKDPVATAEARALRKLVDMQFATADSHFSALNQAFTATQPAATAEGAMSNLVTSVMRTSLVPHDQVKLVDMAFDAAGSGGKARAAYVDGLRKLTKTPLSYESYRGSVLTTMLAAAGAQTTCYPGDLAAAAEQLYPYCYSSSDTVALGILVLEEISRLAEIHKDTAYAPVLVDETNRRMAATEIVDQKAQILKEGLAEIAKLRGDSFRQVLAQLQRAEHPGDAPKIDTTDGLVIGGIKVPRKDQVARK